MYYYKFLIWCIMRIIILKILKYLISCLVSKNRFFLMLKYKMKWSCNFIKDWVNISILWLFVVIIKRLLCILYLLGLFWIRGCLLLNKMFVFNCMCIFLCLYFV